MTPHAPPSPPPSPLDALPASEDPGHPHGPERATAPATGPLAAPRRERSRPAPWRWPATLTVGVWLLCLPVALVLPGLIGLSPLTLRGSASPLLAAILGVVVLALIAARRPSATLVDVGAGLCAGWVVLTMHTALHGTPYGFGGLIGDMGRISAAANRYAHTWFSSDGIVHGVPSDYPPLFPWVIGRTAALSGVPAWRLLGPAQTLVMSLAVLGPYLLWRRLVPPGLALALTLIGLAIFMEPEKPYEVLALGLGLPWALASFTEPPRGRLPWLGAGILGGLQILLYQGYLLFLALGILALIIGRMRGPQRWAYGRRVVGVIVLSAIVAAPYLVPYLGWDLVHGLQMTDRYQSSQIAQNPFPFLAFTPLGVLTALGVLGLWWYRRRAWWATPMIALVLSMYAYRVIAEVGFVDGGQTEVFEYTVPAIAAALAMAGVLSLTRGLPRLVTSRVAAPRLTGLGRLLLLALVLGVAVGAWHAWLPGLPPTGQSIATTGTPDEGTMAFTQALPDGRYPPGMPGLVRQPWFPIDQIRADVRSVLGPGRSPQVLSDNEQLYSYVTWPGYLGAGAFAAAATSQWYSRLAAIEALARRSPARFAAASAHTRFGAIGVFILQADGRCWNWTTSLPAVICFRPAQFSSPRFRVFDGLPDHTVLIVRR